MGSLVALRLSGQVGTASADGFPFRGLALWTDEMPVLQGAGDPGLDRIEFVVRGIELDDEPIRAISQRFHGRQVRPLAIALVLPVPAEGNCDRSTGPPGIRARREKESVFGPMHEIVAVHVGPPAENTVYRAPVYARCDARAVLRYVTAHRRPAHGLGCLLRASFVDVGGHEVPRILGAKTMDERTTDLAGRPVTTIHLSWIFLTGGRDGPVPLPPLHRYR